MDRLPALNYLSSENERTQENCTDTGTEGRQRLCYWNISVGLDMETILSWPTLKRL